MQTPNTVIERGLGGPICGECARVLPVVGVLNRVCIHCHPQMEYAELLGDALGAENSRELDTLAEIMKRKDMTARGVIRHLFRLGQMVESQVLLNPDTTVGYLDDQGNFHGFFDSMPKMAPMIQSPYCGGKDCKVLGPGITYHNTETCPQKTTLENL